MCLLDAQPLAAVQSLLVDKCGTICCSFNTFKKDLKPYRTSSDSLTDCDNVHTDYVIAHIAVCSLY